MLINTKQKQAKGIALSIFLLVGAGVAAIAQPKPVEKLFLAGPYTVNMPAFASVANVKGDVFDVGKVLDAGLGKDTYALVDGKVFVFNGKAASQWNAADVKDGKIELSSKPEQPQLGYALFFLDATSFVKGSVKVTSPLRLEVYVDGVKQATKSTQESKAAEAKSATAQLKLTRMQHQVLVKYLIPKGGLDSAYVAVTLDAPKTGVELAGGKRILTINDVLEGTKVAGTSISPSGKFVKITYSKVDPSTGRAAYSSKMYEVATGREVTVPSDAAKGSWMPNGSRLFWVDAANDNSLLVFDLESGVQKMLCSNSPAKSGIEWAPNESYFVYSVEDDEKVEEKGPMVQIVSPEDRQPGWRTRSFLYKYDISTGVNSRITYGNKSTYLNGISNDSKSIFVGVHTEIYTERPFSTSSFYRIDADTYKVDTIWKNQKFVGAVSLSPDGKTILALGGPEAFSKVGLNLKKSPIANSYDNQAFLYNVASGAVEPISKDFNPSIDNAVWSGDGQTIVMMVSEGDRNLLYSYSVKEKKYTLIPTSCDVVASFDLPKVGSSLVYFGQKSNAPASAYAYDFADNKTLLLANPSESKMSQISLGEMKDWNFKAKDGSVIEGRFYLPPNFDPSKKYPLIVNYYGGTTPVERTFESRYPLHLYAAMGYVVYVLQPSGAIGYGQEFSARHVNAWGKKTADEIIEGTQKFIKEHSFVDAAKVGCIGASYGGFMTMYLQTRTDIFAAAISHAGISDVTSYWGEGYWGYTYSAGASANSYPWNNTEMYIKQSPLFSADKIKTPILFLHGQVDTNVPIGESIQMFTAMKILGKTAEFVTVEGENHTIAGYKARIAWNNTIFAWFDKYLKGEDGWWLDLYPKKNL